MDPPEKQHALPDTANIDIQENSMQGQEMSASSCTKRQTSWQLKVVALLIFIMCNLLVLYLLHFEHNAHSKSTSMGMGASKSLFSLEGNSISAGKVVSFNSAGKLTMGAGTSINLAVANLSGMGDYLKYLETAPLDHSQITDDTILAYTTVDSVGVIQHSVITTTSVQDGKVILKNNEKNMVDGYAIRGIASLTTSRAVVIVQGRLNRTSYQYNIFYAAADISSDGAITVNLNDAKYMTNGSATNRIGRVSETQFAATYYEDRLVKNPYHLSLTFGEVDSTGKITTTDTDIALGDGNDTTTTTGSAPVPIKSGSDNAVAVAYWHTDNSVNLTDPRRKHPAARLCVLIAKKDGTSAIKLAEGCNERYKPDYFLGITSISDSLFAIASYNTENNYAMTVILVEYKDGKVYFRSDVVVNNDGPGPFNFGNSQFYFYSEPKLTKLTDNRIAVVFHNSARDGLPSTAVISVSSSGTLSLLSPPLPYAKDSFHMASTATDPNAPYGVSVITTLAIQGLDNGRYIAGFLGTLANVDQRCISLVQNRGPSIGVVSDTGSTVDLIVGGKYDPKDDVKIGYTYYSLMNGDIGGTNAVDAGVGYGGVRIGDTVVSNDAQIGIALGTDSILLSTGTGGAAQAA